MNYYQFIQGLPNPIKILSTTAGICFIAACGQVQSEQAITKENIIVRCYPKPPQISFGYEELKSGDARVPIGEIVTALEPRIELGRIDLTLRLNQEDRLFYNAEVLYKNNYEGLQASELNIIKLEPPENKSRLEMDVRAFDLSGNGMEFTANIDLDSKNISTSCKDITNNKGSLS